MKGFRTLALQQALNSKGFNLEEDGDFGSKTEAAVREFQKAEGLIVTGEAAQLTLALLGIITSGSVENNVIADAHDRVSITGNTVNIRTGPSTDFDSIAIADKGDVYPLVDTSGWYPILHNGAVRWVSANYASIE